MQDDWEVDYIRNKIFLIDGLDRKALVRLGICGLHSTTQMY